MSLLPTTPLCTPGKDCLMATCVLTLTLLYSSYPVRTQKRSREISFKFVKNTKPWSISTAKVLWHLLHLRWINVWNLPDQNTIHLKRSYFFPETKFLKSKRKTQKTFKSLLCLLLGLDPHRSNARSAERPEGDDRFDALYSGTGFRRTLTELKYSFVFTFRCNDS